MNIQQQENFYNWFTNLGGDVSTWQIKPIQEPKQRVKRFINIKSHNYKFTLLNDGFLNNYPNIQKLIFNIKN